MRIVISLPFAGVVGAVYALLSAALTPVAVTSFAGALIDANMSPLEAHLLALAATVLSLAASPINVVVYAATRRTYVPTVDYIVVFGLPIPMPRVAVREQRSYLAVNLGGAAIPLAVATYIAAKLQNPLLPASVAVAAAATYAVSRVEPGVGVVTPAFLPPASAFLAALLAGGGPAATYVTAVYGTLVGADLANLPKILRQAPPLASIGGAGIFDGIFLSGVLAVLLSML